MTRQAVNQQVQAVSETVNSAVPGAGGVLGWLFGGRPDSPARPALAPALPSALPSAVAPEGPKFPWEAIMGALAPQAVHEDRAGIEVNIHKLQQAVVASSGKDPADVPDKELIVEAVRRMVAGFHGQDPSEVSDRAALEAVLQLPMFKTTTALQASSKTSTKAAPDTVTHTTESPA